MSKLIVISGTPGTGKTNLAVLLRKKINFDHLEIHDHYKNISSEYNKKKKCYDVDLKKFESLVKEKKKKSKDGLIVDTHISHLLPKKMVDLCIILICSNLKKLEKRLKERKYSKKKIRENLDAEIFQVCLNEAKEKKHKILVLDTSKRLTKKEIINAIKETL